MKTDLIVFEEKHEEPVIDIYDNRGTLIYSNTSNGITNEQMLELLRKDRPTQVIHKVFGFKKDPNFPTIFQVRVDMQSKFFNTTIRHTRHILPYPISEYLKLTDEDREKANYNNLGFVKPL